MCRPKPHECLGTGLFLLSCLCDCGYQFKRESKQVIRLGGLKKVSRLINQHVFNKSRATLRTKPFNK